MDSSLRYFCTLHNLFISGGSWRIEQVTTCTAFSINNVFVALWTSQIEFGTCQKKCKHHLSITLFIIEKTIKEITQEHIKDDMGVKFNPFLVPIFPLSHSYSTCPPKTLSGTSFDFVSTLRNNRISRSGNLQFKLCQSQHNWVLVNRVTTTTKYSPQGWVAYEDSLVVADYRNKSASLPRKHIPHCKPSRPTCSMALEL